MTETLWFSALAVLGGFVALIWGADRFVHGCAALARNLGVPTLVIGLTVVGFGTSAPEILVSIVSALNHTPQLAVGNAIGSNIANIALVLGATAVILPLTVNSETLRREYPLMFIVMLGTLMLIMDNALDRVDGTLLLIGLALILYGIISLGLRKQRLDPIELEFAQEIPDTSTPLSILWIVVGLLVLLASSKSLVWGATNIAAALGISDLVIGLTVVAIGTSLPELAASVMSAWKKEPDLAIGNIIGSNMFNLLAVLGLPALIEPHALDDTVLSRDYPVMIGVSVALFIFAYGFRGPGRINRLEGGLLLGVYALYMGIIYLDNVQQAA